jgi:hypothetical protein
MIFNLHRASPARLQPASRDPIQLDHLQPAESQPGSLVSSQPRCSPARSSPAIQEPARLDRVQPVKSQPISNSPVCLYPTHPPQLQVQFQVRSQVNFRAHLIEMLMLPSRSGRSRPTSREPDQLDHLQPAESQLGSIASSQLRSRPAQSPSREPARLYRVQPVTSQPSSTVSS